MEDLHSDNNKKSVAAAAEKDLSVTLKTATLDVDLDMDGSGIGEDILAWLSEETLSDDEVMTKLLDDVDDSLNANGNLMDPNSNFFKTRFVDDPYSSSTVFQTTPSSYVTINGNEESCGSSFSDWESSVMASVDVGYRYGNGVTGCFAGVGSTLGLGAAECKAEGEDETSWVSASTTGFDYGDAELATFLGLEFI